MQPLANDLGLSVDTSCDRDDQDCVADVVDDYDGPGNILICWEHDALHDIVKELGDDDAPDYPDDRYVISVEGGSEGCTNGFVIGSISFGLIRRITMISRISTRRSVPDLTISCRLDV